MRPNLIRSERLSALPERYRVRAQQIAERVREIDAALAPCVVEDIRDAVLRLRGQLRPQQDIDPVEVANEFKVACRDLPAWAISESVNDFLGGRIDNHTGQFMPTCAEFAKRARSILVPVLSERSALRVEASKLFERAEDEARRQRIEVERSKPAVRRRIEELTKAVTAGLPVRQALTHAGLSDEAQKRIDALKQPREFVSKLDQTKIVRGGA